MKRADACPVCCDAYTAKVRPPVACPSCSYAACVRCAKTYLLSALADPSCMNCGLHWSRAFLDEHFTATWRNGELRKHRARVLFDRERSLLPATQPFVEREAQRLRLEEAKAEAYRLYRAAVRAKDDARHAHSHACSAVHAHSQGRGEPPERRSFVAACPTEACRGFLSTQYKCGTCLRQFCAACREPKADDHVCDPGTVETLKAILKDSRACPGCGTAIHRVSGCDQMYCTNCDVAFSYATGQRIQGVIHNPHYFERLRQLQARGDGAEGAPRRVQAMEEACGRWPRVAELSWLRGESLAKLTALYRTGMNLENAVLPHMAARRRAEDNVDLRVRYCLQSLSDKGFMEQLERRERSREFEVDVREALQLFVLLSMELCYQLLDLHGSVGLEEARARAAALLEARLTQIDELVSAPLARIGAMFKRTAPEIRWPEAWTRNDLDVCHMPHDTAWRRNQILIVRADRWRGR